MVASIEAGAAKAMIDRGEAVVVDVREPAELLASGRIPGAVNIPLNELLDRADPASPRREPALAADKAVILYCASGARSNFAGEQLLALGYRSVFNLGGLRTWVAAGLPVGR
jgi:rhodanese-related sulfurtransferase